MSPSTTRKNACAPENMSDTGRKCRKNGMGGPPGRESFGGS
jgi:hypothetical protein